MSETKPISAALTKDLVYVQELFNTAKLSDGNTVIWDIALAAQVEFDAKYGRRVPFATMEAAALRADWKRRYPYGFEPLLPSSTAAL